MLALEVHAVDRWTLPLHRQTLVPSAVKRGLNEEPGVQALAPLVSPPDPGKSPQAPSPYSENSTCAEFPV